eukprot:TRINITY_DN14409_c0_g1_i1.p1 TRINITY_DN14409_c0_g1~~TRINITY_DN14409_c0_g1_i1.p1  ORF type:complete len:466 (+),score=49.62 TRINITY_DN14409_c0_g1_i1:67-1398(+)
MVPLQASLALLHVLWTCQVAAQGLFDVRTFGAAGDGTTDDTVAVRRAAAAVAQAGRGMLLFPAGPGGKAAVYLTGAFNISSNTRVEVESGATLLASTRGEDWPLIDVAAVMPQWGYSRDCDKVNEGCRLTHQSFLFSWNTTNVSFGGGGVIDCNARFDTWWACAHNFSRSPCNGYSRPHCVLVTSAANVVMEDLHVRNSPDWTLHFSSVHHLRVRRMNVSNPAGAPNADGIDVDCSQDVIVEDSTFSVGDDALCVKSGIDFFGRRYHRPSRDIIFRRIHVGAGHGITIGSETSGDISNVLFEDIDMQGTSLGIRMKSQRGRGGTVSNVTYRNIRMSEIRGSCVTVSLNYHPGLPVTNATATPVFRGIDMDNVHCESGRSSFAIDGLPEQSILDLNFRNVSMGAKVGKETTCHYAQCTCDARTSPCPSCCRALLQEELPEQVIV